MVITIIRDTKTGNTMFSLDSENPSETITEGDMLSSFMCATGTYISTTFCKEHIDEIVDEYVVALKEYIKHNCEIEEKKSKKTNFRVIK